MIKVQSHKDLLKSTPLWLLFKCGLSSTYPGLNPWTPADGAVWNLLYTGPYTLASSHIGGAWWLQESPASSKASPGPPKYQQARP